MSCAASCASARAPPPNSFTVGVYDVTCHFQSQMPSLRKYAGVNKTILLVYRHLQTSVGVNDVLYRIRDKRWGNLVAYFQNTKVTYCACHLIPSSLPPSPDLRTNGSLQQLYEQERLLYPLHPYVPQSLLHRLQKKVCPVQ